mmetsp:Transcript_19066/g.21385  ORF Transcript_19066/g.21385 Transcript_19066/m.21385 type:complete len:85 (-) Transcript_19066:59-313(-)
MPERFDPENEYFSSQSNISSFLPFSHGLRSCAGKSLAMLEMKVLVSYILLKLDKGYELDKKQENNEYIRFGGGTQFKVKIKIIS